MLDQLDIISKQSNLSYSKDLSEVVSVTAHTAHKYKVDENFNFFFLQISLKNVHLSEDYGIILTWSVNLRNDEFKCDAVFVYKETNVHEILLDNSPVSERQLSCNFYTPLLLVYTEKITKQLVFSIMLFI